MEQVLVRGQGICNAQPNITVWAIKLKGALRMPVARTKKPFFPDDKPRSWVIAVSAGLLAMPLGGLAFLGAYMDSPLLLEIGRVCFAGCGLVVFPMMLVFMVKSFSGQYRDFKASSWRDRPW
ncbi:MAG: hypothetical protein M0037_10655 [Betaproteobacteria bacterium]|nr:hypothetical protein [Betaproteobacteria bacterium]